MVKQSVSEKLISIFLTAATAVSLFSVFYYTIVLSKDYLNSDVFDTILWAKASYESGSLFAEDFCYAAFLPFGGSLIMLPLIYIFGVSFTTQIIGMVIFEIIFFISLVLFAKKINFNKNQIMIFLIAMCSLWLCGKKFREMFCQHIIYYSLSVLFILIGYTLLSSLTTALQNKSRKKSVVFALLTFIFFFLAASDGFQIIFISIVPIIAGFVMERYFCLKTELLSEKNMPEITAVLITITSSAAGLLFTYAATGGYRAPYATAYSFYDSEAAVNWTEKLRLLFTDYYQLFEVSFSDGASFTDISQFLPLIRFAFATLLLFSLPATAIFYKKIREKDLLRIFFITLTVSAATIFLWFFGIISGAGWRLIPMVTCLLILFIYDLIFLGRKTCYKRFSVLIYTVVFMFSAVSVISIFTFKPSPQKYGKHQNIIDKIVNSQTLNGYGDFWISSVLNVMSSDKINSYNIRYKDNKPCLYQYQQFDTEKVPAVKSDSNFLVLSSKDASIFEKSDNYKNLLPYLTEKYDEKEDNWFVVYFYSCDISYIFS